MSQLKVDYLESDNGSIILDPGVSIDFSNYDKDLKLPTGSSSDRSPVDGLIRFNSDEYNIEYFNGTSWVSLAGEKIDAPSLLFSIDPSLPNAIPSVNFASEWTVYAGRTYGQKVLDYDTVTLLNSTTDWIGYFPAYIFQTAQYTISFDYFSDSDGSVLVLDNDGVDDNGWNTSFTANTQRQSYTATRTISTNGEIRFFFRRSSGGNITITNFKFTFPGTQIKDASENYGTSPLLNGVTFESTNGGILSFDGNNDYIDIPTFDLPNEASVEVVIQQDSNKNLEFFGTNTTVSAFPHMAFAYTNGNIYWLRYIQGSGDRPHIRAEYPVSLSNGNWHHLVGTYNLNTNIASLYYNGQLVNSSSAQRNSSSYQGNFGGNATTYAFNGNLGLLNVYGIELSEIQVNNLYQSATSRFSF